MGDINGEIVVNTDTKHFLDGTSMPLIDPEMLSEIVSTAADISLLVTSDARISAVMVNPAHPVFGRLDAWIGKPIADVVTDESHEKLIKRLEVISRPGAHSLAVEINHVDQSLWEFPVRYSMHNIGRDKTILMMGRDMRPVAEMQQQLVMAQMPPPMPGAPGQPGQEQEAPPEQPQPVMQGPPQ